MLLTSYDTALRLEMAEAALLERQVRALRECGRRATPGPSSALVVSPR